MNCGVIPRGQAQGRYGVALWFWSWRYLSSLNCCFGGGQRPDAHSRRLN